MLLVSIMRELSYGWQEILAVSAVIGVCLFTLDWWLMKRRLRRLQQEEIEITKDM